MIEIALSFSSISQPRVHQFEKSLCPSARGGPEDSKTPATCNFFYVFGPSYGNLKKIKVSQNNFDWRFRWEVNLFFFWCAITCLKIMQTSEVGAVLKSLLDGCEGLPILQRSGLVKRKNWQRNRKHNNFGTLVHITVLYSSTRSDNKQRQSL